MSGSQEEKNQDYQWLSKTDHAADGPTLTLAEKQVGEPPLRLLGAPLHDLFGLEPSQITDNLTYKNLKISQGIIRW